MGLVADEILEDLLSRDPHRIWSGCGAVRQLRDRAELVLLAEHAPEIRKATKGVNLGGMLRPNAVQLEHAFRILEFAARSADCLCGLYTTDDAYDPNREAENGHVRILETVLTADRWVDYYRCQCASCGKKYRVTEREYHYTWWRWEGEAALDVRVPQTRLQF